MIFLNIPLLITTVTSQTHLRQSTVNFAAVQYSTDPLVPLYQVDPSQERHHNTEQLPRHADVDKGFSTFEQPDIQQRKHLLSVL